MYKGIIELYYIIDNNFSNTIVNIVIRNYFILSYYSLFFSFVAFIL